MDPEGGVGEGKGGTTEPATDAERGRRFCAREAEKELVPPGVLKQLII